MKHKLKTVQPFFSEVLSGVKTFEVRKNDRDFRTGDILQLAEWDDRGEFTGRCLYVRVKYILNGGQYGIESGTVVMAIERMNVFDRMFA